MKSSVVVLVSSWGKATAASYEQGKEDRGGQGSANISQDTYGIPEGRGGGYGGLCEGVGVELA